VEGSPEEGVVSRKIRWLAIDAYRRLGGLRLDLILTTVGLDALILWFDVALVALAVKTRRTS